MIESHEIAGWKIETELIEIHKLGEIEHAIEYSVISTDGKKLTSVREMDDVLPDEIDEVREELIRGLAKSNTPPGRNKINNYMAGTIGKNLIKRGNVYKSENIWNRE